jgi:hypothetical protein
MAGPIAAPALAGHASMTAASPRRNGNDHARSTAKAWKSGEWVSAYTFTCRLAYGFTCRSA